MNPQLLNLLLNLRGQASGNPIAHVVDEALLNFIDMVDSDLGTNILLKYVDPYVEERNRYDETNQLSSGKDAKVPQMSSLVLTLKCLALLIKKLSNSQLDFDMNQIAPLTITVLPPLSLSLSLYFTCGLTNVLFRHCMMRIQKLEDRVLLCVFHYSLLCKMNRKFLKRYEGLKRILVNRIFCIIISSTRGGKVKNWHLKMGDEVIFSL